MAILWVDVRDFCETVITNSDEQKFDLTYLWQKYVKVRSSKIWQ